MADRSWKSNMSEAPLSEVKDDWFDYRLENDPRFRSRIEAARASLRAGRGFRLEDVEAEKCKTPPLNQ
jgi:hypothetical protein